MKAIPSQGIRSLYLIPLMGDMKKSYDSFLIQVLRNLVWMPNLKFNFWTDSIPDMSDVASATA